MPELWYTIGKSSTHGKCSALGKVMNLKKNIFKDKKSLGRSLVYVFSYKNWHLGSVKIACILLNYSFTLGGRKIL